MTTTPVVAASTESTAVEREIREAHEELILVAGATRAVGAGNRLIEEEPDRFRTCFERDRDRILHSTAFRRLAGKTQVFIFPGDHQRTRLTHALEVAQVATAIARSLGLNVALTEAIALGHDCGHGPGGHASEEALSPYIDGGYYHAVWGADVVLGALNLCAETLDGIRNHSWSRPVPSTPEAHVVRWADRIAYVCHDFEDAMSAGVVEAGDLPDAVAKRCGTTRSAQINSMIDAVVESTSNTSTATSSATLPVASTAASTAASHVTSHAASTATSTATSLANSPATSTATLPVASPATSPATSKVTSPVVSPVTMTAPVAEALGAFRAFNFERIYLRPASNAQAASVIHLLRALVEHLADYPELLPGEQHDPLIDAVTYVAGMTDRYACRMAMQHLGWAIDDLPRGFDLF